MNRQIDRVQVPLRSRRASNIDVIVLTCRGCPAMMGMVIDTDSPILLSWELVVLYMVSDIYEESIASNMGNH